MSSSNEGGAPDQTAPTGRKPIHGGMIGVLQGDGFARLRFRGYFAALMDGIVDGAFNRGYTVGMCPDLYGENPTLALADPRFEGFVWYSTFATQGAEDSIRHSPKPIVLMHVDAQTLDNRFPSVKCDNALGMRLAANHLAELGHTKIGFLFDGRLRNGESAERGELLFLEAQERGLEVTFVDIGPGQSALETYLRASPKETALVAHSDHYAIEAMQVARRLGIRVPHDISVVGFDSTDECNAQNPPLTSIAQPLEAMGMVAAETLIDLIAGHEPAHGEIVLPCGFDVRGSTARACAARAA